MPLKKFYSSSVAGTSRLLLMGFFFTLLLSACDEILPKPSEKGANTFACKVNGKSWVADAGSGFNSKKFSVYYNDLYKPKLHFVIFANRNAKNGKSYIVLALEDLKTTGTQYFAYDTHPYPGNLYYKNHAAYTKREPNAGEYVTNSRITGSITITHLDTVKHIVAGKFGFTAEKTDGSGKTVKVTDGRFDIKYGL